MESHVIQAMQDMSREYCLTPHFYLMLADKQSDRYSLFCELHDIEGIEVSKLSKVLDQKLMDINMEYKAKRSSKRLNPLSVIMLRPGTGEFCKQFYLAKGRREQQFKLLTLLYRHEFEFPIEEHHA